MNVHDKDFIKTQKKKHWDKYRLSTEVENLEFIKTGFPWLDYILGGGVPLGRVSEIYWENGCGKTTIALQMALKMAKVGYKVLFVDTEGTYPERFKHKNIMVAAPDSWEQAVDMIKDWIEDWYKLVILDSVTMCTPMYELENSAEANTIGKHARLMNKMLRMVTDALRRQNSALLLINQLRAAIWSYWAGTQTTGGKWISYACSLRLELRVMPKKDWIMNWDDVELKPVTASVIKSKMRWEKLKSPLFIKSNGMFSEMMDIMVTCLSYWVIIKNGAFIKYNDHTLWQWLLRAALYLKENMNHEDSMLTILREQLNDRLIIASVEWDLLFSEDEKKEKRNELTVEYNKKWKTELPLVDISTPTEKSSPTEEEWEVVIQEWKSFDSLDEISKVTGKGIATIYRWKNEWKVTELDGKFYINNTNW